MMTLVTGGSGSGKSEYAERLAAAGGTPRIYVATMIPWDDEGRRRIEKHRAMRAGKGFETVECYTGLERLADEILALRSVCGHLVVVTNNVFNDGGDYDSETVRYMEILADVNRRLAAAADAAVEVIFGIPVKLK